GPQRPRLDPKDGTWRWGQPEKEQQYLEDAREMISKLPGRGGRSEQNPAAVLALAKPPEPGKQPSPEWQVVNTLAEKYGFYEVQGEEVYDDHPGSNPVPVGPFQHRLPGAPKARPG